MKLKKWMLPLATICALSIASVQAAYVTEQVVPPSKCILLDKQNVAKGEGTLHGVFAFTRNMPSEEAAIKEIGFMRLDPGSSIGLHTHKDNEDTYIILDGTGVFTDGTGKETTVGPYAITIARPSQSHALKNNSYAPLYFLDIIAKNNGANLDALKADMSNRSNERIYMQVVQPNELIALDKKNVAKGHGILHGNFGFTRDLANDNIAIKEIGWMTLNKGDSIGLHQHKNNEDTYIIIQGQGVFTDGSGNETIVGPGTVTIARPGESHALRNDSDEPLVFIDLIAQNHALAPVTSK